MKVGAHSQLGSLPESRETRTDAEQERRHGQAQKHALAVWKAAQPAGMDHPYLVCKKVRPGPTLREVSQDVAEAILGYRPNAGGEVLVGRLLVVPIRIGNSFATAELIDESGRTSVIAGRATMGGYWAAQSLPSGDGTGLTLLIGNGIAIALSAAEATGHPGIATFSGGDLKSVAAEMRNRYPAAQLIILADRDGGQAHAEVAARAVGGLIALPRLEPGGATDFNVLACDQGLEAVARAIADAEAPKDVDTAETESETKEIVDGNQTQAAALVTFARAVVDLFHDPDRNVYAQDRTTLETRRLDGQEFREWLSAKFYHTTGKTPRDLAIREALSTMKGIGLYGGESHSVYVRVAKHGGHYYLDLAEPGKTRAVRIGPGSWEVVNDPPVHFIRPPTMRPLPEPIRGGDLSILWQVMNIPEDARLLILAWWGECLRPDTPYPVLELVGEQGSAKSTTQDILRELIDPNACNLRGAPKVVEDIFIAAATNWVTSFENISHFSPPMQDALCVLATGGGFAKRKLFTDADESVISVKRPVIVNGIAAAVTAQDLVDRTISIELPVITERAEVNELRQTFKAEHGRLLGALLDVLAEALARLPSIFLPPVERPRLAEYARFGMAVAEAAGRSGAEFMRQFKENREDAISRTIDANPVASATLAWLAANPGGAADTASGFMARMEPFKPVRVESWPWSPKGFADALRRAAPSLRQIGVECRRLPKTGGVIRWVIGRVDATLAPRPGCPANLDGDTSRQDIRPNRTLLEGTLSLVSAVSTFGSERGDLDNLTEIEI